MEEWIEDYDKMFREKYEKSPYAHITKKVDNLLMYCSKCKTCWESFYSAKGRSWTKYGINQIPILNKKRELCPPCKKKEEI